MEKSKVEMYLATHAEFFLPEHVGMIKETLDKLDDEKYSYLMMLDLKNPTTMTLISVFAGGFGIDRFMLGDTGMGVLKLLTGGLCGILTIVDWCTMSKNTKEYNFKKIMQLI